MTVIGRTVTDFHRPGLQLCSLLRRRSNTAIDMDEPNDPAAPSPQADPDEPPFMVRFRRRLEQAGVLRRADPPPVKSPVEPELFALNVEQLELPLSEEPER